MQSEQINEPAAPSNAVLTAISKIMADVGSVQKAGNNDFHRYKYATAADILHKLQPLMAREGLIVFQTEQARELIMDNSVLSVTYEFTLAHRDGETWPTPIIRTGMSAARNTKGGFDDKALNKCHTSAHKYFHLTLFEIPTGDYDDADADPDTAQSAGRSVVVRRGSIPLIDEAPVADLGYDRIAPNKRTMAEISAAKQAKESTHAEFEREIGEAETLVALAAVERAWADKLSGEGGHVWTMQEKLEKRRAELQAPAEDVTDKDGVLPADPYTDLMVPHPDRSPVGRLKSAMGECKTETDLENLKHGQTFVDTFRAMTPPEQVEITKHGTRLRAQLRGSFNA